MADEVGLKVKLDGKEVERGAKKAGDAIESNFKNSATKAVSSVRKISNSIFSLKGVVAGIAFGFATKQVADLTNELIKSASDAEETANKYNVVFKGIEKDAISATEAIRKGFGLSNQESQKLVSNTADILTGFGFTKKAALDMSIATQKLAGDLGSFNNLSTADASERLTKALTGETESLKALGIVIRQDTKEYKSLVSAIQQAEGVSLLQAKAMANIQIATEQSGNAIGDFSRSIDSFANQSRIAKSSLEDIKVELGQALLPVANQVLQGTIIPLMEDLSKVIIENKDEIKNFAEQGINGLKLLQGPATLLLSVLAKTAEGYSKIAQIANVGDIQAQQQQKVADAYKNTNKSVMDYATILQDIKTRLANIKEYQPNAGTAMLVANLNKEYEKYSELLNIAQSARVNSLESESKATEEIKANTEAIKTNNETKGYSVVTTQELTKVNNDYIESLNQQYTSFQYLKTLTDEYYLNAISGANEYETQQLQSLERLRQEEAIRKEEALTALGETESYKKAELVIEEVYAKKRSEVNKKYDDLIMRQKDLQYEGILANSRKALDILFRDNKAYATATAIIDGVIAVQKALATPPPLNIPLSIATGAVAAANVAQINGVGFADGTEFVTGGGGPRTDSVDARLSVGERVVDANTNARLNGVSNEDLVNNNKDIFSTLGLVNSLFSQEEIAQRLTDYMGLSELRGFQPQG